MKKIIFVLLFLILLCTNAFARWTTVLSAGGAVPVLNFETEYENVKDDISAVGFAGYIDCFLVNDDNRFSFFALEAVGGVSTDDIYANDATGLSLTGMLGAGVTLVNTDKAILALHGVLGYEYYYFDEKVDYKGYNIDTAYSGIYFAAGVNLSAAFRFKEHFGMNVGTSILLGFGGSGEVEAEHSRVKGSDEYTINAGRINIFPRLGFSWFF